MRFQPHRYKHISMCAIFTLFCWKKSWFSRAVKGLTTERSHCTLVVFLTLEVFEVVLSTGFLWWWNCENLNSVYWYIIFSLIRCDVRVSSFTFFLIFWASYRICVNSRRPKEPPTTSNWKNKESTWMVISFNPKTDVRALKSTCFNKVWRVSSCE